MAHKIPDIPTPEPFWHGIVPRSVVVKSVVVQVACERGDGTLNIHDETTTCDICSPTIRADEVE